VKNLLQKTGLTIIGISVLLLLVGCGGETSSNEYLGKLPGMAKEYSEEIDGLKKDLKESTDMAESFSLDKEIDLLEEESDRAIEEYLASNPITDIPFEQQGDYQFTVKELSIHPEYSSDASRLQFIAKVTITEDIKKSFGFARDFFAYIKAVDKEGKSLTRRYGVMMNYNNRGPFKADMEVEMYGSLDGPADMVTFEKLVFVSKEEYEKVK